MLNAGVIGMGIGEKHALAYQQNSGCRLKSICDFGEELSKDLTVRFPDVNIYRNDQSVLKDDDIDVVSIASYDNYHLAQILQALQSEKHVMAEKPLCLNQDEMLQIYEAQKQNPQIKLSSNLVLRTNSRLKKFRKDNKKAEFGKVYYLEGDYYWGRKNKLFGWRAEMDFYSIILGAAIHMIDLVMWILDSKPVSVQAVGNNISSQNTRLKYNSFAVILLKFENGAIAKLTGNGGCVHPHFHSLKIFGTERTAIQNITGAYYLDSSKIDSKPIPIIEPYPEKETRAEIIHSFIDSIINPTSVPLVPQQDVYDSMSVCFAAEEAMSTEKNVYIKYLI